MKIRQFACLALLSISASTQLGCAATETISQLDQVSYLVMTGKTTNRTLQIDEGKKIELPSKTGNVRYSTTPGTHRVRVWEGDQLIVNREVYSSQGQTFEMSLP